MVSIIIPSVGDQSLPRTLEDIRHKAKTNPEVIVVYGKECGMRTAINKGVAESSGDYIIKCDDHCTFDEGFDLKLLKDIKKDQIVVPIRYELDVDKWKVMLDNPIVCERLAVTKDKIGGVRWVSRTRETQDQMIVEDMVFQGSFYMMSRRHWENIDGLQTEGYGEFAQEAIELALKTWEVGGRVIKNKNTWYAHKHRKFGRTYAPPGTRDGVAYSLNKWRNSDTLNSYLEYFNV